MMKMIRNVLAENKAIHIRTLNNLRNKLYEYTALKTKLYVLQHYLYDIDTPILYIPKIHETLFLLEIYIYQNMEST